MQVVSQPDRPSGRGRKLTPTPIARQALEHSLSLLRTEDINREALAESDVMVVIAFGQKIAEHQVHHPRLGSLNLHASRLPLYRGAAPINWAMIRGETITGNSIIRLAPRMDAGAILGQSQVSIGELETAGELHDRLALDGADLMVRALRELASGSAAEIAQEESQATLAPKLSRESSRLDWTRNGTELARRVRGLYPWPGCRVRLVDGQGQELTRLILVRARAMAGEGSRWQGGEIMMSGGIAAGEGSGVEVFECQPESKRPMTLAEYRRGHVWQPGLRLESVV